MKKLYEPDGGLLPYVNPQAGDTPPAPKQSVLHPKHNRNPLATAAFIVSLTSIFSCFFLFPSFIGVALGVGALVVALKNKLPKKIAVISISVSMVTLLLGSLMLPFLLGTNNPAPQPYVPPAYTYDPHTGIAFKYNPLSNFPCDATGVCSFEAELFPIDPSKCPNGGSFTPDMADLMGGVKVPAKPVPFPKLTEGKEYTLKLSLKAQPNDRLVEGSSAPITCQ